MDFLLTYLFLLVHVVIECPLKTDSILQGDVDYIKYVDEVAKEKSQYTFPDTLTGIEQLANDDYTILHTLDVLLRGTYLENPFAFPDIKLFGKTRPVLLLRHIWFVKFQLYIQGEAHVFGQFCEAVLRSLGDLKKKKIQ